MKNEKTIEDEVEIPEPEDEVVEILPSTEDFSAMREEDVRTAIADIRRRSEANGGFVTYDEINAMLPESLSEAVETEQCLQTLERLGVHVIREEDVAAWTAARTKAERVQLDGESTGDPIRLYFRQMGAVGRLSSLEERALFRQVEEQEARCRALFNAFEFAPKMY